jgi:hypothetical protein
MAIAFGTAGTVAVGATTLTVPYPASVAAGNLILVFIANKYPNNFPNTPADFTLLNRYSGGAGTGIDNGAATISVYSRIATSALTGNISFTITGGNSAVGRSFRYTKDALKAWDLTIGGNALIAPGTTSAGYSITPNFSIIAGDALVSGHALNGDLYNIAAVEISSPSTLTFTQRQNSGTTNGQDCLLAVYDYTGVISTPGTVTGVTANASGSTLPTQPNGAGALVRLREVDIVAGGSDAFGMMGIYGL